jgi:hypothetical protein
VRHAASVEEAPGLETVIGRLQLRR